MLQLPISLSSAKSQAHNNTIRGFLLEKGMAGLETKKFITSFLRTSITGEIIMNDVEASEIISCRT